MNAAQVSACFAAIKETPPPSQLYTGLPAAADRLPEAMLQTDGDLSDEASAIFRILSNPAQIIAYRNFAASNIVIETRIITDGKGQNFVILSLSEKDVWDLALLTDRAQMLAVIDDLAGLDTAELHHEEFAVELNMPAVAILAAMTKLVTLAEHRAGLDGTVVNLEFLMEPISLQHVEAALKDEENSPDFQSPISKLALATNGAILMENGSTAILKGMEDLVQNGLCDDEFVLTADGQAFVHLFKNGETISALNIVTKSGAEVMIDNIMLFHLSDSIVTGVASLSLNGDAGSIVFCTMQSRDILAVVDEAIIRGALSAETSAKNTSHRADRKGFCPQCGKPHVANQKFCKSCGEPLT